MKRFLRFALVMCITLSCVAAAVSCGKEPSGNQGTDSAVSYTESSASVRIITVNIANPTRFENDYILYRGQTPDDYLMNKRYVRFCALVDYYLPDVIMMQEVNGRGGWWDYLIDNDDAFIKKYPKYGFVGTVNLAGGTNGGGNRGTFYNQVYYNKNKFELVAGGTFFCRDDKTSPENQYTGDYEGVYNANNTTTCSWAVLKDKKSGVTAVYGSTHLCTRPSAAQCFRNYGQARNLTEGLYDVALQYKTGDKALPIVVAGDFNGDPSHEGFYSYPHMTENAHYTDSKMAAPVPDESGTARVFGKSLQNNGIRIDYVFNQGAEVTDYFVLKGTFSEDKAQTYCDYNTEPVLDGSQYDLTDHLPVYAKLKISGDGYSVAPDDYVNPLTVGDTVITEGTGINATAKKIIFDSPEVLAYVGKSINKGFAAEVVEKDGRYCLKLTAVKSRIDPVVSIDYGMMMRDLGLSAVQAETCGRIKIEYRLAVTKDASVLHFGAVTSAAGAASIGVNTAQLVKEHGEWTSKVLDFTAVNSAFWSGDISYFAVTTGVGLMAGDGVYIRSIELL